MNTRVASAACLLAAVCGPSVAQQPSGTQPPLHPSNAGDPGDGGRRFSVVVSPKVKGEYCEVEQGHLSVRDGDKLVCACRVQADTFPGGRGFTFTVAAAYLDG